MIVEVLGILVYPILLLIKDGIYLYGNYNLTTLSNAHVASTFQNPSNSCSNKLRSKGGLVTWVFCN